MKEIPGIPTYFANEKGEIFSTVKKPVSKNILYPKPYKLVLSGDRGGYLMFSPFINGKQNIRKVHRVILETFVGPCPPGMACSHLDGNRKNNNIDNLEWATTIRNNDMKNIHGTVGCGEKHGGSKIKSEDVPSMIAMRKQGQTYKEIADRFNLTPEQASRIIRNKAWVHIPRAKNNKDSHSNGALYYRAGG